MAFLGVLAGCALSMKIDIDRIAETDAANLELHRQVACVSWKSQHLTNLPDFCAKLVK
jgi:hypothetical protein